MIEIHHYIYKGIYRNRQIIIETDAIVEALNNDGVTPHFASGIGHPEIVQLLLEN